MSLKRKVGTFVNKIGSLPLTGQRSMLQTGPSINLKIQYAGSNEEKMIGYATNLTYTVFQGQKTTFVVDNPFPAEISQGAERSFVRGNLVVFLPKGQTPETLGLVPYRQNDLGEAQHARSKYFHFKIYDRATTQLIVAIEYVKISNYTISYEARLVSRCSLSFEGILVTPGNGGA